MPSRRSVVCGSRLQVENEFHKKSAELSRSEQRLLIDRANPQLSISAQCAALDLSCSMLSRGHLKKADVLGS